MVAMTNHTKVDGQNLKNLIKKGLISQEKIDFIINRTKKVAQRLSNTLKRAQLFMPQLHLELKWQKVI